ncbi:hypothetical protein BTVI_31938 [Pitangus sulphuratus]|nr:hypothetical protein BTVI_31938 [Pitangus sulphuratus]
MPCTILLYKIGKAVMNGELRDTFKSTALVLMGDFSLPKVIWEHHAAGTTGARRFLKNLDDNFMEQVPREPTQKDALLDLLLVNRVDLDRNIISLLQDEDGHLTNGDGDKAGVFNTFFAYVFNSDDGPRGYQCPQLEDHDCENDQLTVNPEIVQDLLVQLDPYKSMRPGRTYPRILEELADVISKLLSMIFEWSWESRKVSADWKLVNIVQILKKELPGEAETITGLGMASTQKGHPVASCYLNTARYLLSFLLNAFDKLVLLSEKYLTMNQCENHKMTKRPYLDSSLLVGTVLWDTRMMVANGPNCMAENAVGMS